MVCLMINSGYTVVNGTVISEYSCVKNMEGSEVLFQYFARETDEGRPWISCHLWAEIWTQDLPDMYQWINYDVGGCW